MMSGGGEAVDDKKVLASSSDFVVIHSIPTKLLRYGLLHTTPGLPPPHHHSPSHMVKSKTTSFLSDDVLEASCCVHGEIKPERKSPASSEITNKRTSLHDILILVIPGNPGIIDYYEVFMRSLYVQLNQIIPVWGVSHAGHVNPPHIYARLFDEASSPEHARDNYNLEGQIQHKVSFIRRFVPKNTRLILIGHSIGAYICLEILHRLPELHVIKAILLFPTIERMADSPQGSLIHPLCQYRWLTLPPQYALYYTPEFFKRHILHWYFGDKKVEESSYKASLELFHPQCLQNVLYLGNDELNTVKQLNIDVVTNNMHKLIYLYGKDDPWCPISYYEDMKSHFPDGDIFLCTDDSVEHAFVLESGVRVAQYVYTWVVEAIRTSPG